LQQQKVLINSYRPLKVIRDSQHQLACRVIYTDGINYVRLI